MYAYRADLVLTIDLILFSLLLIFALSAVFYAFLRESAWKRRNRGLLNIKKNVLELMLSGQKADRQVCLPIISQITPEQFLDVVTNRNRSGVFFNESEQSLFKHCFVSPEKIRELESMALRSWNKWRRIEAILCLGYCQSLTSLGALKRGICQNDNDIVYFSVVALGQIRNIASAKILLNSLKKRRIFRYKIFSVLESFPPEIAHESVKLIEDRDPQVRVLSIRIISKCNAREYLHKIAGLTRDHSEEVRAAACDCLGEFRDPSCAGTLEKCLEDDFWLVRSSAVRALEKVLGSECIRQIISRINDPSLSVIDSVKEVIARHIESSLPYIENFLTGNDQIAKRAVAEAIDISGYAEKTLRSIVSGREEEKGNAVRILEKLLIAQAHFGLEGALLSLDRDGQNAALAVIGNIDREMAEHLKKYLSDKTHAEK